MHISLSKKQISQIRQALSFFYDKSMLSAFDAAVKLAEPLEINWKNFGKKTEPKDTKKNHKKLFRDLNGQFLPTYNRIAKFVYDSPNTGIRTRLIKLEESNNDYLMGADLQDDGKQKSFRRDRIIGGNVTYFKQKIFYSE